MAGGVGDAASTGAHSSIILRAIEDGEALDETERHLVDEFRPMTDEEQQDAEAEKATAAELADEHGPDYHGFGHPPSTP